MPSQYQFIVACITAIAMSILCSCSRQISSIAGLKKLDYAQTLTVDNTRSVTSQQNSDVKKAPVSPVSAQASLILPEMNKKIEKPKYTGRINRTNAKKVAQRFGKAIQNQTASIKNTFSNEHVFAYSRTFDTGGFLGLAVLCLIAGIVLAYFGFHALAALLWVIGIILLAAAILFFILWLIGRAVAD